MVCLGFAPAPKRRGEKEFCFAGCGSRVEVLVFLKTCFSMDWVDMWSLFADSRTCFRDCSGNFCEDITVSVFKSTSPRLLLRLTVLLGSIRKVDLRCEIEAADT